jgi:serine/threonine protein kinase
MVFELLGPNLEDLLNYCNRSFSLTTIVLVAEQMLERIEHLHARNFIHRDIKPDNFVIGRDDPSTIFMIDYGLAKRYRDPKTKNHILFRENKSLIGTARYTSINTHMGFEQSRRDDIEGLIYVSIYFSKGVLPWQGIRGYAKKEEYEKIKELKVGTPPKYLCKGLPSTFHHNG